VEDTRVDAGFDADEVEAHAFEQPNLVVPEAAAVRLRCRPESIVDGAAELQRSAVEGEPLFGIEAKAPDAKRRLDAADDGAVGAKLDGWGCELRRCDRPDGRVGNRARDELDGFVGAGA